MTVRVQHDGGPRPQYALLAVAFTALATAGCLGSLGPSPGTGSVAPSEIATDAPSTAPSPSVEPTGSTATPSGEPVETARESSSPPGAALVGPAGGPIVGDLGTFSWDGLVSDAPWIVQPTGATLDPARHLRVRFDGGPPVAGWTARWARVRDGVADNPRKAGSGDGKPLAIEAPPGPGSWSLQVEARFDGGGRAVWYWRVKVDR